MDYLNVVVISDYESTLVKKMIKSEMYKSDPVHSLAEFSVRHMMIATVKGRFTSVDLQYTGDGDDFSGGSVIVTIDLNSVETFDEKRNAHLRSDDFFSVEKYPKMIFKSKEIRKTGENEYSVRGDLTIRDITREITVRAEHDGKVKDPYGNIRVGVSAYGELIREDFGLKWNSMMETGGVLVGSRVKFEVHSELVQVEEE